MIKKKGLEQNLFQISSFVYLFNQITYWIRIYILRKVLKYVIEICNGLVAKRANGGHGCLGASSICSNIR